MRKTCGGNRSFTTTLPLDVIETISTAARALGLPKNRIITLAVTMWDKDRRQAKLARSYRRHDPNAVTANVIADDGWEGSESELSNQAGGSE